MKLISNEYRTCSMSDPAVAEAANEAQGRDIDPLDVIIGLEAQADIAWQLEQPNEPRRSYINRYVAAAIDNL